MRCLFTSICVIFGKLVPTSFQKFLSFKFHHNLFFFCRSQFLWNDWCPVCNVSSGGVNKWSQSRFAWVSWAYSLRYCTFFKFRMFCEYFIVFFYLYLGLSLIFQIRRDNAIHFRFLVYHLRKFQFWNNN